VPGGPLPVSCPWQCHRAALHQPPPGWGRHRGIGPSLAGQPRRNLGARPSPDRPRSRESTAKIVLMIRQTNTKSWRFPVDRKPASGLVSRQPHLIDTAGTAPRDFVSTRALTFRSLTVATHAAQSDHHGATHAQSRHRATDAECAHGGVLSPASLGRLILSEATSCRRWRGLTRHTRRVVRRKVAGWRRVTGRRACRPAGGCCCNSCMSAAFPIDPPRGRPAVAPSAVRCRNT